MKISKYFTKEIEYIKNPILREIVVQTLNKSPECIVKIPASSSGRYHPKYSLGKGGLMRHIKAAVGIAHSMIDTEIFDELIKNMDATATPEQIQMFADVAYSALILHDCCKPDNTPKHGTRFDHPLKAAALFTNTAKEYIDENKLLNVEMDYLKSAIPHIKDCIASHMGQWNTAPYAKGVVLPKPKNSIERFVHTCDYLASRKYLLFDFNVYNDCEIS